MNDESTSPVPVLAGVIGGAMLFPVSIPLWMTILFVFDPSHDHPPLLLAAGSAVFFVLPIVGVVLGIATGNLATRHGLRPFISGHRLLSILLWIFAAVVLIGVEIGFVFSPLTLIGLGNTSTAATLWVFPICTGGVGLLLGVLIASVALVVVGSIRVIRAVKARVRTGM